LHRNRNVETKASDEHSSSDDECISIVDTQKIEYRIDMTKEEFNKYLEYKLTYGMSNKNKALIKKYENID